MLFVVNRSVANSLQETYAHAPTFADVLAATRVDRGQTDIAALTKPGEHVIVLTGRNGSLRCRVRVRPAANPQAPLLLYHHGINEFPYTSSWWRLFHRQTSFTAHQVCVQAPYHDAWLAPFSVGFASLENLYQMFAGSLRLLEVMQGQFTAVGAAITILAGVSWGGMTSLLYEGTFQKATAVIPMFAAPDLAQVMWDIAAMFKRSVPVPLPEIKEHLDFTAIYQQCDPDKLYPVMGENDLFFRKESHPAIYSHARLLTLPAGHITGMWNPRPLRRHIARVLRQVLDE